MQKKTNNKESLGQRIRQLRRERELSQQELGQKIGCHLQSVVRYEKDLIFPTADILKKMSEVFKVSIDYLVFGDTNSTGIRVQNKELFKRFQQLDRMNPDEIKDLMGVMDVYIQKNTAKEALVA